MRTSFFAMLQVLFIGLKLAGIINWPWFWVLAPLWFVATVLILGVAFFFLGAMFSD